jgi:hypothetical protein
VSKVLSLFRDLFWLGPEFSPNLGPSETIALRGVASLGKRWTKTGLGWLVLTNERLLFKEAHGVLLSNVGDLELNVSEMQAIDGGNLLEKLTFFGRILKVRASTGYEYRIWIRRIEGNGSLREWIEAVAAEIASRQGLNQAET